MGIRDSAETIVRMVREVVGKGNDFATKITYQNKDAEAHLTAFRTSPTPVSYTHLDVYKRQPVAGLIGHWAGMLLL